MPNVFINFALTWVLKLSIIAVTIIISAPLPSPAASDHNSTVNLLFQKKIDLSQSLDSLNLLKQSKKREGRSFSEIELKQKQILDSLHLIRKMIQTDIATTSRFSDNKNGSSFLSFFRLSDWVIFIIAVALLFTGILLLFRTVTNALFSSSKSISSNKSALPLNPENHLLSEEFSEPNIITKSQETNGDQIHFEPVEKNPDQPDDRNDKDLETNIIKAASEGMSIQEISRLFHLSSDHITLILKLAESRKN